MHNKLHIVGLVSLLLGGLICCNNGSPQKINLEKRERTKGPETQHRESALRIAVGGMVAPATAFGYYRQLLDYIGEKLGRHVEFVDREGYAEINELVRTGKVDAAFVCSGPYVDGRDEFGMELLAAPQAYGERVYYSYIIVGKNNTITGLQELRGKTFAFTDPLSNTGKLVPTFMLARLNETPDSFFKKYVFTQSHDKSIKAVAQGIVDGAAVDSLIWEYLNRTAPEFTSKTKIITKSPPYGMQPVVVRPGLDPRLKQELKKIFLNAHKDEKGRTILRGMMIDRFVPMKDSEYDSIREMKRWIAKNAGKGAGK